MRALVPAGGPIRVSALPGPFSTRRVDATATEGQRLDEIVAAAIADPVLRGFARVWLVAADGAEAEVPEAAWPRVRPRAGVTVLIRVVPRGGRGGGGGKDILRVVLAIAVVVAATVLGGPAGLGGLISGATGIGAATANALGSLAITMAGTLALNALIPPPKPNLSALSQSRLSLTLTGVANQATPFGPVPRIYGRVRVFPPLAARTISEAEGENQFLRALFDFGYGPLDISEIRIGTVPIEQFDGVEMEIRAGRPDDAPVTLYPRTVREDGYAIRLRANHAQIVETRDEAKEALLDVTFVGLVRFTENNQRQEQTVRVRIEHRPAGSGGWTLHAERDFTAASEQRVTRGERIVFDTPGRREIRITRITADSTNTRVRDDTFLTAVRSIQGAYPIRAKGRCLLALRVKATDQLSGTLDQVNAVAQARLPVWTGSAWVEQATRNPAWAYLDVLRGAANRRPVADARIDLPEFMDWAEECDAAPASGAGPRREFNGAFDTQTTVFEALRDIAAAGRAAFGMRDGKFSIVRDRPQTVPIQHFTPRNSRGFTGRRVFRAPPHAIAARYIEPAREWSQQEVMVYADGYDETTATRIENLEWFGITNRDQAWRETRYAMAVAQLRPDTYELTTDIEHLLVTRGDLVRVTHDVPAWGVSAARVKGVTPGGAGTVVGVTLDEAVPIAAGRSYALRTRQRDGGSVLATVSAPVGEAISLAVEPPLAGDNSAAIAANLIGNPTMAGVVPGTPGGLPTGWTGTSAALGITREVVGSGVEDGIAYVDIRLHGTATGAGNFEYRSGSFAASQGQTFAYGAFFGMAPSSASPVAPGARVRLPQFVTNTVSGIAGTIVVTPAIAPLRTQLWSGVATISGATINNARVGMLVSVVSGVTYDFTMRLGFPAAEPAGAPAVLTPFEERIQVGDLALLGEAGRESVELIVKEIRPGPDLSATLVLVDAAPAVHQAETAPIPPWDPQSTLLPAPPASGQPAIPTLGEVFSDSRALVAARDGTLLARIGVVLRADPADAARGATVQIRWRRALTGEPWQQGAQQPARGELLLFTDALTEGETYEVAARAVSAAGVAGVWTAPVAHVVLGKTALPSDVADFRISGRRLDWSHVADPDLAGYRIRWSRSTGVDWGTMLPAHGGLLTASPFVLDDLPAGPVSIAIKAVDDGDRESEAAAAIFTDLGDPPLRLGVAEQDMHADGFLGSRFGALLDGADLVAPADATLPMWGASAASMWGSATGDMWASTLWPALAYEEDLSFPAPPGSGRVLVDLRAEGAAPRVLWRQIDAFWTDDAALLWTSDAAPMWAAAAPSDWADLVAPIPASALPAHLRVEVDGGAVRPRITALLAVLDAAPVTEVLADVALAAGGTRLPIARSYAAISAVVATLQAGTGARTLKVLDKDPALGPLLQAYDAAGDGVAASVDATIHGY